MQRDADGDGGAAQGAGDIFGGSSFLITELEEFFCVAFHAIHAVLKGLALGGPGIGLLREGGGNGIEKVFIHHDGMAALAAEMVGDFVAGDAQGPGVEGGGRGQMGVCPPTPPISEHGDGDFLEDILGVGVVADGGGDECRDERLCECPGAGGGFNVGLGHEGLSGGNVMKGEVGLSAKRSAGGESRGVEMMLQESYGNLGDGGDGRGRKDSI